VLLNVSCYKVRERKKTLDTTVMKKIHARGIITIASKQRDRP